MQTAIIIILAVIVLVVLFVAANLFTMSVNDFVEKIVKKTLWLWLPFHALGRLLKEFREKYLK